MLNPKKLKVIFDTNIWISFLIGKQLASIKNFIIAGNIQIILTDQLLAEIALVSQRPKLQKYFAPEALQELLELLKTIGKIYAVKPTYQICRDAKDNFLLDLIATSKANYLVTGAADLLELKNFKSAKILTPKDFEVLLP